MATLMDSGSRREFESGAVRDVAEGKGRMDQIDLEYAALLFDDDLVIKNIYSFTQTKDVSYLDAAFREYVRTQYDGCMPTAIMEISKQFEDGAKKYSPNNWRKGMNLHCFIDSALRHYMKALRGDTDEPHKRAAGWNIMCGRWTFLHKPELDDIEIV